MFTNRDIGRDLYLDMGGMALPVEEVSTLPIKYGICKKANGIRQSMSGKGNCFDNAEMESFFSLLEKELVRLKTFHTKEQARYYVFDSIKVFYNS